MISVRTPHLAAALGVALAVTPLAAQSRHHAAHAHEAHTGRPYDHVVIVSFDGMRADAVGRAHPENLLRLSRTGASARNATTIGNSTTLPSHSSMLSGVLPETHRMDFDDFHPERGFIAAPTIFYVAHEAGFATAMFVGKTKLRHIATPGSIDVWSLPHWSCERISTAAAEYLRDATPGITFVHYSEPDDAGHMHRWMSRAYLAAIERADRCLGTVLEAVEHRADADRFLVIATADHGGHGRRHGTQRRVDLHIPWIAWGRHVRRGTIETEVQTVDTAATALTALGLPLPASIEGHAVRNVFARP